MKQLIERLIEEQKANGFANFAGTHVDGTVPLRQSLLNEAATGALRGKSLPFKGVNLLVTSGGRLVINIVGGGFFIPKRIDVVFPESANLARDPVLRLGLHVSGIGGMLVGLVGALVPGKLPEGVALGGDHVAIDVRRLLVSKGLGEFVPLLTQLRFSSDTGVLRCGFTVDVPAAKELDRTNA